MSALAYALRMPLTFAQELRDAALGLAELPVLTAAVAELHAEPAELRSDLSGMPPIPAASPTLSRLFIATCT